MEGWSIVNRFALAWFSVGWENSIFTPTLHYSINALSLQAYEPPMVADQSPVLWAGILY